MDTTTTKDKLARFGRELTLLLNRGLMYQKSHPMVQASINQVHKMAELILTTISPLVFILNRNQFYIDEEQLDPRINASRIATLFKSHKIQSVSFESGLSPSELNIFIDIFSSLTMSVDAEQIKKALFARGAFNIKVNHVLYKKVTEDDQIVSRDVLKEVAPAMETEDSQSRKKFMDALLETVLTEEFANTLNIQSLLANPKLVSRNMIQADLESVQKAHGEPSDGGSRTGTGTLGLDDQGPGGASDAAGAGPGNGPGPGGAGSGTGDGFGSGGPGHGLGTGTGDGPGGGGPGHGLGTGTGDGPGGGGPGHGLGTGTGDGPGGGGPGHGLGTGTGDGPGHGLGTGAGGAGTGDGAGMGGPGYGTVTGTSGGYGDGASGTGIGGGTGIEAGPGTGGSGLDGGAAQGAATAAASAAGAGAGAESGFSRGADAGTPGTEKALHAVVAASGATGPSGGQAGRGVKGGSHGPMLLRQLEIIQAEVQKQLQGQGDVSLEELADAVFEMKRQFFEELQTQKALGVAYANEESIVRNINQLTDDVILQLIREEYGVGKITTQRLAQIILRLIPEPQELRRLLPQIKRALIEAGMSHDAYLALIDDLKKELENEDLTRILEESSEAIGVDSEELIDEFKRNPDQAAKLIYLASEINKGTGDESALADILVEYVEKMTTEAAMEAGKESGDDDSHLQKVVSDVESVLLQQLGRLNVGDDVLARMEGRINARMDSILDKMRVDWLNMRAGIMPKKKHARLSVLQTLEHSVNEDEELVEILKIVRAKVEAGEIEENNYSQIDAEITKQRKRIEKEAAAVEIPEGVLNSDELMFILEKEIARANRYNAPFSALAFSFVSTKPRIKSLDKIVTDQAIMAAALDLLLNTIREVDFIGYIAKNKMVAVLPMVAYPAAKSALGRVVNLFHARPLKVREIPVDLRVAGVVAQYNADQMPDAQAFAKLLSNRLMDMVARVKNIQVLF
jgi:hypothetical protein